MANVTVEGDQDGGGLGLFYVGTQVGIFWQFEHKLKGSRDLAM